MAVGMSIRLEGMNEFIAGLQRLEQEVVTQLDQEIAVSVEEAADVARTLSAVRTGYFKSRWQVRRRKSMSWELFNDAPYALFLIVGTYKMAPQDCLTPAFLYGNQRMSQRLNNVLGWLARQRR